MAEQRLPQADGGRAPARTQPAASDEQLDKQASELELQLARARGVEDEELEMLASNTIWVQSNRRDDRVVIWERDPRHPGGEVYIGPSPTRAFKTPGVQERLFRLEAMAVPPPMRTTKILDEETGEQIEIPNRKYPPEPGPDPAIITATQPGRATPIGRKLDPDLYPEDVRKAHERTLRGMPSELPVPQGVILGG